MKQLATLALIAVLLTARPALAQEPGTMAAVTAEQCASYAGIARTYPRLRDLGIPLVTMLQEIKGSFERFPEPYRSWGERLLMEAAMLTYQRKNISPATIQEATQVTCLMTYPH